MSAVLRATSLLIILAGFLASLAPTATAAGPVGAQLSDLAFSESVDDRARPRDPRVEFDSSTDEVWVSFEYRDFHGGQVSFLARANGEDWAWGDLDCCDGERGRYAFPLRRRSGKDLGGAAYEVLVYIGDEEQARGGFGVRGARGFDSDSHDNGNGNDND